MSKIDLVLVCPGAADKLYQDLSKTFSAIEPNVWAGLLSNACKRKGFSTAIIDMEAQGISAQELPSHVADFSPRFVLFVVTGQNPNASTASMTGAVDAGKELREQYPQYTIVFVGPHVNALPMESLKTHDFINIVLTNEGVYSLLHLLSQKSIHSSLSNIKGIAYREGNDCYINPAEQIVPQEKLHIELPGVDYDSMPPLSQYRTSSWHSNYSGEPSPFASIYTSLGCIYKCDFCMINIINRTDNAEGKVSSDFNKFRYWEPEFTITQFDYLAKHDVKHIKVADEMWVLKPKHFMKLCDLLIERDYGFNIWAYTRVDTVKPQYLEKLKAAGVTWLALGIEAGNEEIRREITKGKFEDTNIRQVVKMIQESGINVIGNYIFGLGHDTMETMQETLDLSLELNTECANFYCATPLPGSPLFLQALQNNWELPDTYDGYGFLSYNHIPSRTYELEAKDVLKFRDEAFDTYFTNPRFLSLVEEKFGLSGVEHIKSMTDIKLKRKLLDE